MPVFVVFAVVWFVVIVLRRKLVGCELGGPKKAKVVTVAFFLFLWVLYILLSALVAYDKIGGF